MTDDQAREARTVILDRIRAALDPPPPRPAAARTYQMTLPSDVDVVERFVERVGDYRAVVHRASPNEISTAVTRALAGHQAHHVVIPPQLPSDWITPALPLELVTDDPPRTHEQLDDVDAVVTGCAIAIAETGTIVLDASAGQGRRVLSLLPDVLVCVVRADQVVGDVPEALARLDPRRPLTWISGPSATSDIELNRIEGVHGPRKLDVVMVA